MEKVKFKRDFSEDEKIKFVTEALEMGSNIVVAKKYKINPVLLSRWINNYRRYGQTIEPKDAADNSNEIIPNYKKEYKKAVEKIDELELKVKILEDMLKKKPRR